jgi:hypothetical protein
VRGPDAGPGDPCRGAGDPRAEGRGRPGLVRGHGRVQRHRVHQRLRRPRRTRGAVHAAFRRDQAGPGQAAERPAQGAHRLRPDGCRRRRRQVHAAAQLPGGAADFRVRLDRRRAGVLQPVGLRPGGHQEPGDAVARGEGRLLPGGSLPLARPAHPGRDGRPGTGRRALRRPARAAPHPHLAAGRLTAAPAWPGGPHRHTAVTPPAAPGRGRRGVRPWRCG